MPRSLNASHDKMAQGKTRTATLLAFPIRGEALLVKLADQLHARIVSHGTPHEAFDLTLSRRPHTRLAIDGACYVEYRPGRGTYHLVIELLQDTRIKVESADFDTIVKFVAQYVADRLSDAPREADLAEAAS